MEEGVTDTQEHTQGGEGEREHERTNGVGGGGGHHGAAPQEPTNQQQPEGQTITRLSHQQPDAQQFPDNSVSCHTVAAVPRAATGSWLTGCPPIRIVLQRTESARAWQGC